MNKAEIVARMARETELTKADANRLLDSFTRNVTKILRKSGKVTLVGFGTFMAVRRRTRVVRNPRTGSPIRIPARRVPRFVPGKDLRAAIG